MWRSFVTHVVRPMRPLFPHRLSTSSTQSNSQYSLPFTGHQSARRVPHTPTLPLEAVSLPLRTQAPIHETIREARLRASALRNHNALLDRSRAPESDPSKRRPNLGAPRVLPPPAYNAAETAAYAALRLPGTLAANVYVMAEALRASPDFLPTSMLDFGSGGAASVMAAARVFASPFARNVRLGREGGVPGVVKNVCLIDQSDSMRSLATAVLQADFAPDALRVASTLVDKNVKGAEFDMVCASYSLNEVVRMAMALPLDGDNESLEHLSEERSVSRVSREKLAERRLRRIVKTLWNKTAPGGIFVVIEDGTAAGFEVISFVRDTILSRSPAMDVDNSASAQVVASPLNTSDQASQQLTSQETASIQTRARVLAPCLHSDTCPFHDNITRHRLCRFRQRLNRPLFSRTVRPLHDGFEDEYFSYVVIQKFDEDAHGKDVEENLASSSWGRLIRAPLMKGKHVALDVCTSSAKLERRVVSKKNAIPGHYSKARHSKWGDVWAVQPSAKPQPVNF